MDKCKETLNALFKLVKENPNNMELGAKIRKIMQDNKDLEK
jgi:hypothetical protein